jgi:hypothetical protein
MPNMETMNQDGLGGHVHSRKDVMPDQHTNDEYPVSQLDGIVADKM